jgi:hypothetical protein
MSVAFLGDLQFAKILGSEVFRTRFSYGYSIYQVTSMGPLNDLRVLLPGEVQYLVVGCLSAMLSELPSAPGEPREVAISKCIFERQ